MMLKGTIKVKIQPVELSFYLSLRVVMALSDLFRESSDIEKPENTNISKHDSPDTDARQKQAQF